MKVFVDEKKGLVSGTVAGDESFPRPRQLANNDQLGEEAVKCPLFSRMDIMEIWIFRVMSKIRCTVANTPTKQANLSYVICITENSNG